MINSCMEVVKLILKCDSVILKNKSAKVFLLYFGLCKVSLIEINVKWMSDKWCESKKIFSDLHKIK